ncbi:MAG: hypothetical protein MJZ21_04090 [archaeon]|nr:hypothetical protein [archaeon]
MNRFGSAEGMKVCCVVDGKVTGKYDVKFENGNAVFTVSHLSTYALMKESVTESGSDDY